MSLGKRGSIFLALLVLAGMPGPMARAQAPVKCGGGDGPAAPGTQYDRIVGRGAICIGVRNALPPFSYKDPGTGKWEGFDVALAQIVRNTIAEAAGKDIELVLVGFDRPGQVLDAVEAGRIDLAFAAVTRTRGRELGGVDFSSDYFLDRQELVVDKSKFDGLDGISIAVLKGSTAEAKWTHRHPDVTLVPCASHKECTGLIQAGKVQGYGGDRVIIMWQILKAGLADRFGLSGLAEFGDFEDPFWMEPYAAVLQENQSKVRDLVNLAIDEAWEDDVLDMLFQLHFGDKSIYKGSITYDLPHMPASHVPEVHKQ